MLFIKEMTKLTERMRVLIRTNQIIEIVKDVLLHNNCDTSYVEIEEESPGIYDNKGFDDVTLTFWLSGRPGEFNKKDYDTKVTIEISQETDCNEPLFGGKSPWNRVTIGFSTSTHVESGEALGDDFEIDIRMITAHSIRLSDDSCYYKLANSNGDTIDPKFRDGKMYKIYEEIREGLQILNVVKDD